MHMTLPPPPPAAHLTPILLFYSINLGVVVLAVIGGGRWLLWLWEHDRFPGPPSPPIPARQVLTYGLGGLWLLDALLQFQPMMVTQFVSGMLTPLLKSQPAVVQRSLAVGIHLWGINPLLSNLLAAWLQLAIGLAIVLSGESRWRRAGLWGSVGWGLIVFVFGEGLGQVFSGGAWMSGAPGSALLYAAASLLLLAPADGWASGRVGVGFHRIFAALFGLGAFLQAWPRAGWWFGLGQYLQQVAAVPQPSWISAPIRLVARGASAHPVSWNLLLVVVLAALMVLWTLPARRVTWLRWWITWAVVFVTWWMGQDFGILGGMGTDPNTGAIVLLMLVSFRLLSAPSPSASADLPAHT
jgi:hypothetical protein